MTQKDEELNDSDTESLELTSKSDSPEESAAKTKSKSGTPKKKGKKKLLNGNPDFWIQDRIDRKFMIKLQKGYNIE